MSNKQEDSNDDETRKKGLGQCKLIIHNTESFRFFTLTAGNVDVDRLAAVFARKRAIENASCSQRKLEAERTEEMNLEAKISKLLPIMRRFSSEIFITQQMMEPSSATLSFKRP